MKQRRKKGGRGGESREGKGSGGKKMWPLTPFQRLAGKTKIPVLANKGHSVTVNNIESSLNHTPIATQESRFSEWRMRKPRLSEEPEEAGSRLEAAVIC